MPSTNLMTRAPVSRVFRRARIKRRDVTTGLFENEWQDISTDVKKWGNISIEVDAQRLNVFKFSNAQLTLENHTGRYNPENYTSSLWYGYASRNRTLLKIETGFVSETVTGGLWERRIYPSDFLVFDEIVFDSSVFDAEISAFYGLIMGDLPANSNNEVQIQAFPLSQIFREYPARLLTGWTSTGITASQFITMLRDHTDGAGSFVFRSFFSTSTNFNFTTTSNVYTNLNTSTAEDVIDANCWEIVEKLAEAEVFMAYIDRYGVFNFKPKSQTAVSTSSYFFGNGFFSSAYGNTIKKISKYGPDSKNFYSRVEVRWNEADTSTSYAVFASSLTVAGNNAAWNLGLKTYQVSNNWIPNATVAGSIASAIFDNVSSLKNQIEFTTSFIPHLNVLDVIEVSYDASGGFSTYSLWDAGHWADTSGGTSYFNDLIWDGQGSDSLQLLNNEFRITSIKLDLDRLETAFIAKET